MTGAPPPDRRRAAALRYVPGETSAPQIVATGDGMLADRIIALAREHGIPVHENPDLVNLLTQLPPDTAIPPALYLAVAEVIAFLLRTANAARA
ncbi:Flagellar biosynthetic protein FlhB [Luteitalea pratensis]|jgi:flagellar biosynthesis protein|uniref:Flagellar biosynthetic protein FlhB n=1 Tax=Luteitalea pratensis TaxID=1855912 RepID=A0A143PPK8_LUTPR|nr:EscU/YscU/HrcU family type III secretion system export apparatus switch protein [Luteitalea pratensis]AMY10637.1 Flagellar biosynthetic protein FlhB [Luteitalea pratensis]